jgi:5-methylthioadenosine/S-adenosylhomocysteine deaminase
MNFRPTKLIPLAILVLSVNIPSAWSQSPKEKVDLLVTGGTVVTMNEGRTILDDGALAIKGDSIVAVGSRTEIEGKYSAPDTLNASGKLVLPGFINGHTHVPMTLFRGLHDDVTLDDWLRKYIFPAEAKNVTEEFVRWGRVCGSRTDSRWCDATCTAAKISSRRAKPAGMRGVLGGPNRLPAPDNKEEPQRSPT